MRDKKFKEDGDWFFKMFAHTCHFLLSPSLSLLPSLIIVSSHLVSYFHPFKGPCGTRGRKTGRLLARARMIKQEQSSNTRPLWLYFLATTVWQHCVAASSVLPM